MVSIFYVEDEPFLAKIVKETLESREFKVTLVTDGARADIVFNSTHFDICVLDIMLPNKSGYEIASEIRAQTPDIPILFLTAKDQTTDVIKGFNVGGNDYIRKPFSMEELIARIENLLELTGAKSVGKQIKEATPIGKSYIFHPQKLELHYREDIKILSHRESQIIELLCKHQNEVTERKDILKTVWGDDSFYNSRNLDVYITKLRNYFKKDPGIKIITLKGLGYQFLVSD